jgi:transcriptional regulator with XRE-family HTH domain
MTLEKTSAKWEHYAQELGERLCSLRREAGLSQEQVAQSAEISTFTYRKLEHGQSNPGTPGNPRLSTLLSLSDTFGVDLKSLLP